MFGSQTIGWLLANFWFAYTKASPKGEKRFLKRKEKKRKIIVFHKNTQKKFLFLLNRNIVKLRLIPIQNQRLELKTLLVQQKWFSV